jgi:hypothetical protein
MLAITALDVALAGVLATAFVGIVAPVVQALIARGDREHQRTLARDSRTYAAASGAYEELLRSAYRTMTVVNRLYEWQKNVDAPDPGIPDFETQEQIIERTGRIAAFGSEAVLTSYNEFSAAAHAFVVEKGPDPDLLRAGGKEAEEALRASGERRRDVASKYKALGQQVRSELR